MMKFNARNSQKLNNTKELEENIKNAVSDFLSNKNTDKQNEG